MKITLWLAQRLRIMGSGNKANASGITIAVSGVAVAIIIMEATLAVVLGFKNQITERVLGFEPPVVVLPAYSYSTGVSDATISASSDLLETLREQMPESDPTLTLSQPGIIKTDSDFCGLFFKGYGNDYEYGFEQNFLADGQVPTDSVPMGITISKTVSTEMNLSVGDRVNAYFFVNDAVRLRKFTIQGLYDTGFSEYDNSIAYAPIATLQRIAALDSIQGTSIALKSPIEKIELNAQMLQEQLIDKYQNGEVEKLYPVDNAKHTGAVFFNWLSLLDTNVVVIFILMSCVAAFTLISSMFILILDRVNTIGVLRALGARKSQIRMIFTNMAMKAVLTGLIIGNCIAIPFLLLQQHFGFLRLDSEMYYLHQVPIQINPWWFVILNLAVAILAWLVLLIPSRAASRISPATVMRFE